MSYVIKKTANEYFILWLFQVNIQGVQYNIQVRKDEIETRAINVRIGNTFVQISRRDKPQPVNDDVLNYRLNSLQWGIHIIEFLDMVKEGDIKRANIDLKRMLPFCYSWSVRSMYFKEIVDFIMKTEVLLSEQLAMRVRVGSFVNPKGGVGNNKAADMHEENTIMKTKSVIKPLGAGKTDKALVTASAAAPVMSDISHHLEHLLNIHIDHARGHSHKDRAPDVMELLEALPEINPFSPTNGLRMREFHNINDAPFGNIDKSAMNNYLAKLILHCRRGQAMPEDEEE